MAEVMKLLCPIKVDNYYQLFPSLPLATNCSCYGPQEAWVQLLLPTYKWSTDLPPGG